jgi:surface protein
MRNKIIAKNKQHLQNLIDAEIFQSGNDCDLNHIDTSSIADMSYMFAQMAFNGDISQWDVSNVTTMERMFFNARFDGDISNWNVSNVRDMDHMFAFSCFQGEINDWTPYQLEDADGICEKCNMQVPYWAHFENAQETKVAIENYIEKKLLSEKLSSHLTVNASNKKVKL